MSTSTALFTPSRAPPPVDISTIEAAKENIQPLVSGRSASQLASLSSHSRSGLGSKLAHEHRRFEAQLAAVDAYEKAGEWTPPADVSPDAGLSIEEVQTMAEDPLDIHHQYARFVIANYPAGASAANKLVPLLENSTRRFLDDERYRNDPRYLRLWNLYAKHIECPEDCYKFLFAKGVGERLAMLYEEYAAVLEQAGRRTQADQVYALGVNRSAAPLDRLKKRYAEFTARMLIAPPVPSPPRTSSVAASTDPSVNPHARPALAGAGMSSSVGKENKSNGSAFAIFRDDSAAPAAAVEGAEWKDLGTVEGRKRENETEATAWKGETMPMHSASKPAPLKLEVFRDADAPAVMMSHLHDSSSDVFGRSMRGPSEAEMLRKNPFKNYSSSDSELASIDPLEGLVVVPPPKPVVNTTKRALSTSGSGKSKTSKKEPAPKPTSERVACDLKSIYPEPGKEFSFEELMMRRRGTNGIDDWPAWEWNKQWKTEARQNNLQRFERDIETGYPLLHDRATGAPLYDFLPRPTPVASTSSLELAESPTRSNQPRQAHSLLSPSPEAFRAAPGHLLDSPSLIPRSPLEAPPMQDEPAHLLAPLSLSPAVLDAQSPSPPPAAQQASTPSRSFSSSPIDLRRQPSPTINTREAQAMIDGLFAKTLNFDQAKNNSSSSSDSDSEPSTEDDSEDDERAAWADIPVSQLDVAMSQFTSQGGMTSSQTSEIDPPFVPFSQTASQMQDSLFGPSQFSQLTDLQEESEPSEETVGRSSRTLMDLEGANENEGNVVAKPRPMQLFRDAAPVSNGENGFRPVMTRAPFGEKSATGPIASASGSISALAIHHDEPQGVFAAAHELVPSSQPGEVADESFEDFETPIAEADEEAHRPGLHMGRRPAGVPNRYAPFIHAMTPVTERTGEYTAMSSLSTSQRSRRDSAFPATVEEDEDESDSDEEASTEDDDDAANQAFDGFAAGATVDDDDDEETTSNSSRSSSSEDEEDERNEAPAPLRPNSLPVEPDHGNADESSHDWRESTRKDGHFDGDSMADRSVASGRESIDTSYDASLNTSLPEGYTITGNQSGMTTGMVVAETARLSLSSDVAPVDPWSDASIAAAVARADPPVLSHANVRDRTSVSIDNLPQLQKAAKKREGKNRSKDRTGVFDEVWEFQLDGQTFPVRAKLGEGAFGAVFRVAMPSAEDEDPDASFDYDAEETTMAVKIERPTNLWEFHILNSLHSRLDERARRSVVAVNRLDAYANESYLFVDVCTQGSLLDAVNNANELGIAPPTGGVSQGLDEILAMFFVTELLRVVESFHRAGFIHGDLKIDNCLVRLEDVPNPARNWSSKYDRTGAGCWDAKGLKVIDFGRTLDLTTFAEGQSFLCSFEADQGDCLEMRERRSWTYEPDYFGAAGIAFTLLFGRPIETTLVEVEGGARKQQINQAFRRYHQADLWNQLFEALLNPKQVREGGAMPIVDELARVRSQMEDWLEVNSEKNGKSLKKMIKDMMKASLQ